MASLKEIHERYTDIGLFIGLIDTQVQNVMHVMKNLNLPFEKAIASLKIDENNIPIIKALVEEKNKLEFKVKIAFWEIKIKLI